MFYRSVTLSWLLMGALPCFAQSSLEQRAQLARVIEARPGATCLDAERLVAHVNMWLEGGAPSADLRVIVIGDTTNRQAITFELRRGSLVRKRDFPAAPKSCDELHAVLGLAIALAIDAERIQQLWLAPLEFEPRWLGSLLVSGSYGVPLDAALGSQVGLEISWSTWLSTRLDLLTQVSWGNRIGASRGRFDTLIAAGSLQVCAGGRVHARLRLAGCGGAALGALHAWGNGYARNDASTGPWLATRLGVRFELDVGMPWLLDLEALSSLLASSFYARSGGREVSRGSNAAGLMLSLGPGWSF